MRIRYIKAVDDILLLISGLYNEVANNKISPEESRERRLVLDLAKEVMGEKLKEREIIVNERFLDDMEELDELARKGESNWIEGREGN